MKQKEFGTVEGVNIPGAMPKKLPSICMDSQR